MIEKLLSLTSNGCETVTVEDASDCYSTCSRVSPARKRTRIGSNSGISCASRFKGVVQQHNGNWGCQIYAQHQRIWLGTFKTEEEAAMAYDSASIKLRQGDFGGRNLPFTKTTIEEHEFQNYFSTEAVMSMIKDRSYKQKLANFIMLRSRTSTNGSNSGVETNTWTTTTTTTTANSGEGTVLRKLFRKELTPSDVGKLNRLVIPKKHAVKFFPQFRIDQAIGEDQGEVFDGGALDVQLDFYDRSMKLWRFRYCYWRSSQSYVFTRGWNQFVKEKKLVANDAVVFWRCERCANVTAADKIFFMIDVENALQAFIGAAGESTENILSDKLSLEDGEEDVTFSDGSIMKRDSDVPTCALGSEQDRVEKKGFRLFGVQIS